MAEELKAPEVKHVNPSKRDVAETNPSDWNIKSDGENIIADHSSLGTFKGTMEEFNKLRKG